jgi:SNF2 family DNA or RNA helicase
VGALLADDMGLGKTLQTLCALKDQSLVVCPTSVLPNWANEIKKFRPELSINIFHGQNRKLDSHADITLTTYAILRNDCERLNAQEWDAIVLDEAQAIKNPDSQVARAAYSMKANYKIAMTGTPIENRLDELWSQFHFLNPGYLGGRSDFQERYSKPIQAGDESVAAHLRKRIRPFILRRLKEEVAAELPPRTDVALYCTLTEPEQAVYDAIRVATQQNLLEKLNAGGNVMAAFEALLRLRQASCHRGLVPGAVADSSSKVDLLLETLEPITAANHKSLVFSQWTSFLDRIEPHLEAKQIEFIRLDGSTRDRGKIVDEFQSPDGPKVLLISLKAGGTGLNLTAADHVFLMDPWWNPAVEEQAADRAHRIGQENPVFVHRLIAKNTVEEKIIALQAEKRKLADLTLAATGQKSGITRNELLELLS